MTGVREGDTFKWRDTNLAYCTGDYNDARLNERAVEVPIALDFIHRQVARHGTAATGLEVGNVLAHYVPAPGGRPPWRRVDLHEQAPGVENLDVFNIVGEYPWIVAVSTLEHVDTCGPLSPLRALLHLRGLLTPAGRLLVTVPVGQNPYLDGVLYMGFPDELRPKHEMTFTFEGDRWEPTAGFQYRPLRECTWPSSVWVGEFHQ